MNRRCGCFQPVSDHQHIIKQQILFAGSSSKKDSKILTESRRGLRLCIYRPKSKASLQSLIRGKHVNSHCDLSTSILHGQVALVWTSKRCTFFFNGIRCVGGMLRLLAKQVWD
ncbi:hypothetical protein BS78_01G458700 [Paspalum vaginatum]|nr:hypothetical protein BS78_01G458700 [Paspalum vaginatum]